MAAVPNRGKLYPLFTVSSAFWPEAGSYVSRCSEGTMVGLAIAIFIALFGWGSKYFGWEDPEGHVQAALATAFILGVVSGYKVKN